MMMDLSAEQRTHVLCPVCGSRAAPQFRLGDCTVSDCPACGHRFTADAIQEDHVGSVYDDGYFFGGGAGYDDYLVEAELLRAQGKRYGALLARHATPGRVLDVGAAAGFVQAGLEDAGWESTGLEPNATMVAHARERLGLDTVQGSIEDPPDWAPFDAVCLVQVVGHFYDLGRALSSVAKLTRPGGLCLVEYWRRDSVVARLLGRAWHEYSPPSVLHWYTRDSLDAAMASRGFSPIESGAPKKYISGGHARSLLQHKLMQLPLGRILAAPTALVPAQAMLRYPAFDLEWRLYRRQDTEGRQDGIQASQGDRR
jgi:SAM-dependent methyltransferase